MYRHSTRIIARFADMDAFGHINNARYLTYFEEARIKYVNEVLQSAYSWSEKGIILANAEIDFILPGHFTDLIDVYTRCIHIGTKSFTLEYRMVREKNDGEEVIAKGISVLVMYDYEKRMPIPVPQDWRKNILSYERIV